MDQLLEKLCVIFERDQLDTSLKFNDLDEWDSLSSLSILAMLDSDYQMAMSNADLLAFSSIQDFCDHVLSHRK